MASTAKQLDVAAAGLTVPSEKANRAWAAAVLLCVGLLSILSLYRLAPPAAVSASAPATEFSSERAMTNVRALAQWDRTVGRKGHETGRNYIVNNLVAQGLTPRVDESTVVGWETAATVNNVVAKLPGQNNSKAVLLMAHYDSVSNSTGAADDAAGVATLLETLRALKAGPPLRNDVIFLFTDGEEHGLFGARAFMADNPLAKEVKVALNFEARGTSGPTYMFETTKGNGWLIKEMAKAAPYPAASSYMYEVYKILQNTTDLNVIRRSDEIMGLNFAFVDNSSFFHTSSDNVENLDERSLQHNGSYALALTREFGSVDLNQARKEEDAVYFDVLGYFMIHYPIHWALITAIFACLCFAAVLVVGIRAKRLSIGHTALGFVALSLSLALVTVIARLAWILVRTASPTNVIGARSRGVIFFGLTSLTIMIIALIYKWFAKKVSTPNLAMGGLFIWLLLAVVVALYLPGASYLFVWPMIFGLIGCLFVSVQRDTLSPLGVGVLVISAIPCVILIVPLISALYVGLGMRRPEGLMILVTLLIGLLIPQLSSLSTLVKKTTPLIYAVAALTVVLFSAAIWIGGYGPGNPRRNSLFYGLNSDTKTAVWASTDEKPDSWTSQFLSASTESKEIPEYFPLAEEDLLTGPAPVKDLSPPLVTLVKESELQGVRMVTLRVTSTRNAPMVEIVGDEKSYIVRVLVNGKELDTDHNRLEMRYFNLPKDGIELVIQVPKTDHPLGINVADYSPDLQHDPMFSISNRPSGTMSVPSPIIWLQDSVAVSKTYTF